MSLKTDRLLVEFTDWKLNPKLKANTFEFKVPVDAKQIEFGTYLQQKNNPLILRAVHASCFLWTARNVNKSWYKKWH